ncbi:MAG: hypothetical protein QW478_12240 [Candidatus Micrarchaeaceae archaeon]
MVQNPKETEKVLEDLKNQNVDGFVNFIVGIWTGAPVLIAQSGLPTILIDDLYAGTGELLLSLNRVKKREGVKVIGIASSNFDDAIKAIKLFNVVKGMKETVILDVVEDRKGGVTPLSEEYQARVQEIFGTKIIMMNSKELNVYYDKVNDKEAIQWAEKWQKDALKIIEPSREDIIKSAKIYLALKHAMEEKGAQAVTMDCLTLVYGKKVPAYPCLSHFQMNNDGSTGVCESDLDSTITQLMVRYLNGKPGFVSDPVIDTATNQIIYAHCVATNKVFGPSGAVNPYIIRSHAEDGEGASIQSILPLGEIITTAKVSIKEKALAISQGKTVANIEEDKGCRTKLAAETNVRNIFRNWNKKYDFGWHRVTFYGDIKEELAQLGDLFGLNVFEED